MELTDQQALFVGFKLDGSLRRAGNNLRVTTALVDASSGRSLWAERFDRQLEDVFVIQAEIAESIAGALLVMLTDAEKRAIAKPPTTNVDAYGQYLRGRQSFRQFRRRSIEFAKQIEHALFGLPVRRCLRGWIRGCHQGSDSLSSSISVLSRSSARRICVNAVPSGISS